MITNMFVIKDKILEEYNLPFCAKTELQAKMMYTDGLFQQASEMKKTPMYEKMEISDIKADLATRYEMYWIGKYDIEEGKIVDTFCKLVSFDKE